MSKIRFTFTAFALIALSLTFTSSAHAQAAQVYVTANRGSDLNPCTRTSPCRTIQHALATTVVQPKGEVIILDSGDYSPFTISAAASPATVTSVSVEAAPGVVASIIATSGDAITVNAAGATVVLRGLTLNSQGATNGINATAVGALHIEGCIVNGFNGTGIFINLTADLAEIFIKDTIVRNNAGTGIIITTTTGTVTASISGCRAENNGFVGFYTFNRSRVTVSHSVAAGNGDTGFYALSNVSGATAEMNADQCVASNNGVGFAVQVANNGTATLRVARSTATNNTTSGFSQFGTSTFESLGDNLVRGNTTAANTLGTITVVTGQ